jgi:hypothetical protein
LPGYVQDEFEAYLKCGRLEHGFLRVLCTTCHAERLAADGAADRAAREAVPRDPRRLLPCTPG